LRTPSRHARFPVLNANLIVIAFASVAIVALSCWMGTIREQSSESNVIMSQIEKLSQLLITAGLAPGWMTDGLANWSYFWTSVRICLLTIVGFALAKVGLRMRVGLWLMCSYG
jgi:hypothetical protein